MNKKFLILLLIISGLCLAGLFGRYLGSWGAAIITTSCLFLSFLIFSYRKNIKEFIFKFLNLLLIYRFNGFFITIGIIFFLLKLYVLFIYSLTTVFYYRFLAHLLPIWSEKKLFLEYKKIDNTNFEIKLSYFHIFVVTVIIIINIIFNIVFVKYYLALLLLGAAIRISGFKISQNFPSLIRRFKQFKKDLISIKYHWYKDFRIARDIVYINIISLAISIFLAIILPFLIQISENILKLNFNIWCIALLLHCVFTFLIDTYIIFFANTPVIEKFTVFCQRCAFFATGVTYSNYQLTDNGITNPNPLFNKVQDYLGLPRAVDYDQIKQYRAMKKFFPDVHESSYTYSTFGVGNSKSIHTPKLIQIVREHEDYLRSNCNTDELKTFRLYKTK